jgi:hypothetical protein
MSPALQAVDRTCFEKSMRQQFYVSPVLFGQC